MKHLLVNQKLLNRQIDLLIDNTDKTHMSDIELDLYDGLINFLCTFTEIQKGSIKIGIE